MNLKKNINDLNKYGITYLPNMYTRKQCENYVSLSESINGWTKKVEISYSS